MRVLVVPNVSKDILHESHWVGITEIVRGFREACCPVWFEVLTPKGALDEYKSGENYRLVPFDFGVSRMAEEVAPTVDMYRLLNIRSSPLDFDVILNQRTIFAPSLKRLVKAKTQRMNVEIPIVNLAPQVKSPSLCKSGALTFYGDDELILEACSVLMDRAVVLNEYEKENLRETARSVLAPALLRDLDKRVYVLWLNGLDYELHDRLVAWGKEKKQGVTVMSGGRLNSMQKRFPLVAEIMSLVQKMRPGYRYVVTTPEPKHGDWEDKYAFEWMWRCDRDEFLRQAAQADVSGYCAVDEGIGVCNFEMLMTGVVPVIMDAKWVEPNLPGYPFVGLGIDDMVMKVIWVSEHLEKANEMVEPVRKYIREQYSGHERFRGMYEFMKAAMPPLPKSGSLGLLIRKAMEKGGDRVPASEFWRLMTELSDTGRRFGEPDILNRFYLRQLVEAEGFVDLCDGPEPVYERKMV